MEGKYVIRVNIPQLNAEGRLLLLKLFCLLYAFVNVLFMITTVCYIVGYLQISSSPPSMILFHVSLVLIAILKVINIGIMIYTEYFNYRHRNFFDRVSKNIFIVYFMFLPSLTAAGVFYALLFMEYTKVLWKDMTVYDMTLPNFIYDIINVTFYVTLAMTIIEYSRWKFQVTEEDIGQEDRDDVKPVIDIVTLNRYNIIISTIGLLSIIFDQLIYSSTLDFVVLSAKYYNIKYLYFNMARTSSANNWWRFIPCVYILCIVSVLFFAHKIRDFIYLVSARKTYSYHTGHKISHLNLSVATFVCGLIIFVITLTSLLQPLKQYAYFSIDSIRITFESIGSVSLVFLLYSMKTWKCEKEGKSLYQQLFLYLGSGGRLLNTMRYMILVILGLSSTNSWTPHFVLAFVQCFLSFIYDTLLFLFIDTSMRRVHRRLGVPEKVNLVALLFCIEMSLSIISLSKYLSFNGSLDVPGHKSFTNQFMVDILAYVNYPMSMLYNIFTCGYIGRNLIKWYGVFDPLNERHISMT